MGRNSTALSALTSGMVTPVTCRARRHRRQQWHNSNEQHELIKVRDTVMAQGRGAKDDETNNIFRNPFEQSKPCNPPPPPPRCVWRRDLSKTLEAAPIFTTKLGSQNRNHMYKCSCHKRSTLAHPFRQSPPSLVTLKYLKMQAKQ